MLGLSVESPYGNELRLHTGKCLTKSFLAYYLPVYDVIQTFVYDATPKDKVLIVRYMHPLKTRIATGVSTLSLVFPSRIPSRRGNPLSSLTPRLRSTCLRSPRPSLLCP